jgi:hypothetical protein
MYTAKCLVVNLNLSSKDWQRLRMEFGAERIEKLGIGYVLFVLLNLKGLGHDMDIF